LGQIGYCNFVRINQAAKMSPAMAADIETRLWELRDIVKLIDAAEGPAKMRGPHGPRTSD